MRFLHNPAAMIWVSVVWLVGLCGVVAAENNQQNSMLRVGVSTAPKTLDPALAADAAGARILQLTHPALLAKNQAGEPIPGVADCAWESSQRVRCRLDMRRTFADNSKINAGVVGRWLERVQNNPRAPASGQLKMLNFIDKAENELWIEAKTLDKLPRNVLNVLADVPLAQPDDPRQGVGAWMLQDVDILGNATLMQRAQTGANLSQTRADLSHFDANLSQNGTSEAVKPALAQVLVGQTEPVTILQFWVVPDATTRLLKLRRGELDVVYNDIAPELLAWAARQGFGVQGVASSSYSYVNLNHRVPLLANAKVREALSLAIDRPGIRQLLLGGRAEVADTILPPGHPAAWAAPEDAFDPARAKALLAEAVAADPRLANPSLTLLVSTEAFSQRLGQLLQAQWRTIGVDVTLRPQEWGGFFGAVQQGRFDAALLTWTGLQQPEFYHKLFHSGQTPPVGFNRGFVQDAELDRLTEAVLQAPDAAQERTAALAVQRYLADFRAYLPLFRRQHVLVARPEVEECEVGTDGGYGGLATCVRRTPAN